MTEVNDLKSKISHSIQGEKHELMALAGHSFRPRKYSYQGAEEIENCQSEIRKLAKNPKALKILGRLEKKGIKNPTLKQIADELTEKEMIDFFEALGEIGNKKTARLYELILLHGIGEHDFKDDKGNLCEINEELVAVLCESQDLVLEMVDVIQEHNRPLASRTSGTSGTSQNGS